MNQLARRDEHDSPAVTPAARELIERYPRWPLRATLGVVLVLALVAALLLPALL
jgi:hypothetical protein